MTFGILARPVPDAPLAPQAAWEATCDGFVGRAAVSEVFHVDGRDDEHEAIWEAPLSAAPFWSSSDGYAIHLVDDPDWTPDTLVLVDPEGMPCGFYSGGEAWVDEPHRGRGLGIEMVLAMTEATGLSPMADYPYGMGFSAAGEATHRMAWCTAVERASDMGREVPPAHVDHAAELRLARTPRPLMPWP